MLINVLSVYNTFQVIVIIRNYFVNVITKQRSGDLLHYNAV